MNNFFADIPENLQQELIEKVLDSASFRLERIVSRGHCSPEGFWYDQDESEWVLLLQGRAVLRFEDQEKLVVLNPGDFLLIDRHQRHRVEWTAPEQNTVWLAFLFLTPVK